MHNKNMHKYISESILLL